MAAAVLVGAADPEVDRVVAEGGGTGGPAEVGRATEQPMPDQEITEKDRQLAAKCVACPICARARRKQRGLCFWFVKRLEGSICPACQAYERVYGRKAHEPLPNSE